MRDDGLVDEALVDHAGGWAVAALFGGAAVVGLAGAVLAGAAGPGADAAPAVTAHEKAEVGE